MNIVIVGDSVAWGQGLLAPHKFGNLVASNVGAPAAPTVEMLAHSGAIIGAGYAGAEDSAEEEVPLDTPTIFAQVNAAVNPGAADLVLLNGGINDVNIRTILDPFTDPTDLSDAVDKACYQGMKLLLKQATKTFTKATCRIVVVGYYPILSSRSNLHPFAGVDAIAHLLGLYGLGLPISMDHTAVLQNICRSSENFWHQSDTALGKAVSELAAQPEFVGRIVFASSGFTERNALFADTPLLFGFNAKLEPEDEVTKSRTAACDLFYPNPFDLVSREMCHYASLGHPNVAGASQIAQQILKVLPP